ncbi:MAG: ABC transporter ATP-binding protein [Deltaproteobacteria bacterium]
MSSSRGPVLALRGVEKSYGTVPVLRGVELELDRGDVYAFLGRNGAGKSTTLRVVMGITRQDAGELWLFGERVAPGDIRPRRRIGYVAQEQHFYGWMTPESLGDFVGAFYPTWKRPEYERLLRSLDVPSRKVSTLSGGTRVKLALALALAHDPELLIFDEPTAGLDPVARHEFVEIVRDLAADGRRTLLFSSHLIDEVERISTRVGILEQGQLRYQGELGELQERSRLLRLPAPDAELVELQRQLARLELQVLAQHQAKGELELTLWSVQPAKLAALAELLPTARFELLSLEEAFVALVRSGHALTMSTTTDAGVALGVPAVAPA